MYVHRIDKCYLPYLNHCIWLTNLWYTSHNQAYSVVYSTVAAVYYDHCPVYRRLQRHRSPY